MRRTKLPGSSRPAAAFRCRNVLWPYATICIGCAEVVSLDLFAIPPPTRPIRSVRASLHPHICVPRLTLMERVAEKFTVCEYDLLRTVDGIRGYSLAQGQ